MDKRCDNCRFWSEMLAQGNGSGIEAYCLKPRQQKYTPKRHSCEGWKDGYLGAIDSPPNYGEQHRAAYELAEGLDACQ